MKGIILNPQLILGDDEQKYSIESAEDFINLDGFVLENLRGLRVEFKAQELKASEIFLLDKKEKIKQNDNALANIISVKSVRTKALLSLALLWFGFLCSLVATFGIFFLSTQDELSSSELIISLVSMIFSIITLLSFIASLILCIIVLINLAKLSQSKTLIKDFIISVALGCLSAVFATLRLVWIDTFEIFNILCILSVLIGLYFQLRFFKELAYITNQNLFLAVFALNVLYTIILHTIADNISLTIVLVIMHIIWLIAWIRFKEIRKAI